MNVNKFFLPLDLQFFADVNKFFLPLDLQFFADEGATGDKGGTDEQGQVQQNGSLGGQQNDQNPGNGDQKQNTKTFSKLQTFSEKLPVFPAIPPLSNNHQAIQYAE